MAAYTYSVIGTPPTQAGFSASYSRPMKVPTRSSSHGHGSSQATSARLSATWMPGERESLSLSNTATMEESLRKFTSLSTSSRQRRSVASSPTVPPEPEQQVPSLVSSELNAKKPTFSPQSVTVGFETSPRSGAVGSPFGGEPLQVSGFAFLPPLAPSTGGLVSKKPVGLLSKALSITELHQAVPEPQDLAQQEVREAQIAKFFPDVDMQPLLEAQSQYSIFKQELVVTAYCVAARAHSLQLRKNGDTMLSHCVEVAKQLASMGLDEQTVAGGLVHEVLSGSSLYQAQLEEFMPSSVVSLVERVHTISEMSRIYRRHKHDFGDEKFRRMLVALEDVKAVLIKLADRIHNMRTVGCLPRDKQIAFAQETLEVYSVVANRLGVWGLKAELEDLAFKTLYPEDYEWLKAQVAHRQDASALEATMRKLQAAMLEHGVQLQDISGRPKNLWGIWTKMQNDGHRDISRIFDVMALRVVVSNKHECYLALRALQSVYRCMPERSKDFIRDIKKPNGYQSLHETIHGEGGMPMEVQIRTHKMHYIAEYGFAAHWKYKEKLDSEDEWVEKETQYKRWLTHHKLGILDNKLRPEGTPQVDASLDGLGVAFLDGSGAPDQLDPFLRNDRFKLQAPIKSEVSVLLHTQDSIDTRSFALGTTASQLWEMLGVNDLPGYALTINSRLPSGECALRNGDLIQVVPLSQVLSRSPPERHLEPGLGGAGISHVPGMWTSASSSALLSMTGSGGFGRSMPLAGSGMARASSSSSMLSAAPGGGSGGLARAVRVGGL